MLTLSYGYYKPQTGDRGSVWFPRLEDNFQRLNDHTHDGSNSALIPPSSITKATFTSSILAASWSSLGGGNFKQTVTVPAGVAEINNYNIHFYATAPGGAVGRRIHPTVERVSAATYDVYVNDNTLALTAVYV